jgi:hypothetical protein
MRLVAFVLLLFTPIVCTWPDLWQRLNAPNGLLGRRRNFIAAGRSPTLPPDCKLRSSSTAVPPSNSDLFLPSSRWLAHNEANTLLKNLYKKYGAELAPLHRRARMLMAELKAQNRTCASDPIESELSYMLVRAEQPRRILELAPAGGLSTFWLLSAVLANKRAGGHGGKVESFDGRMIFHQDGVRRALGLGMNAMEEVHTFYLGDARYSLPAKMDNGTGRPYYDYLFFDADHSKSFGSWLGRELIKRQAVLVRAAGRSCVVSMHDVFQAYLPSAEAEGAFEALSPIEAPSAMFTPSKCRLGQSEWGRFVRLRRKALHKHTNGHEGTPVRLGKNPTLYMRLLPSACHSASGASAQHEKLLPEELTSSACTWRGLLR